MNPLEQLTLDNGTKVTIIFAINSMMNKEEELAFVRSNLPCGIKQVQGCMNDCMEISYVANTSNSCHLAAIVDLCGDHSQDSIMIITGKTVASLYYLESGALESLGRFVPTNPAEAMDSGNWTRDGSQFYIVK